VGDATTAGVELEAKFRVSALWPDAPRLDVRANASAFRSRVKSVAGPDNRLDQQPDYTANLGADYHWRGIPLTVGGSTNWTPGYVTRISDQQTAIQGTKTILDAYALWVFDPRMQVRVTASNVVPRDYMTGSTFDDSGIRETATTLAPTSINVQVRLEMKL
jgi:iron complex outermembrane receptor protein